MSLHEEQQGLVGKIIVVWLLIVGILGIATIDAASIFFTRFRLSDAATVAAVTGANVYENTRDARRACAAALEAALQEDEDALVSKKTCRVDTASGDVIVTLRREASTLVAARVPFTRDYTKVVVRETGRPSTL